MILTIVLCLSCLSIAAIADEDALTIAVIYTSTIDDKGWNQDMHKGILAAQEMGYDFEYSYIESVATADIANTLEQLAGEYDIIIAHGSQFVTAVFEVAPQYPEQLFVAGTSDNVFTDSPNVFTYMPQSEETGYVNGVIAGLMTQSNKVGVVGPIDSGDAARYVRGFLLGLASVNPECEFTVSFTGSFNDTTLASEYATTMMNSGCDVLVGPSQQAVGAIRAVAESDTAIWLGQTRVQIEDYPETVLSTAGYAYSSLIVSLFEYIANEVTGGVCIPMNYANEGFEYTFSDAIPADVQEAAEAALTWLIENPGELPYKDVNF